MKELKNGKSNVYIVEKVGSGCSSSCAARCKNQEGYFDDNYYFWFLTGPKQATNCGGLVRYIESQGLKIRKKCELSRD